MLQTTTEGQPHRLAVAEHGAPVESIGQAAAGALLIAIAIVEFALGLWAAGWQQRAIGLSVACVGAAFLVSGVAQILLARPLASTPEEGR